MNKLNNLLCHPKKNGKNLFGWGITRTGIILKKIGITEAAE